MMEHSPQQHCCGYSGACTCDRIDNAGVQLVQRVQKYENTQAYLCNTRDARGRRQSKTWSPPSIQTTLVRREPIESDVFDAVCAPAI